VSAARVRSVSGLAAALVAAIGAVALFGWLIDVPRLRGPIPGLIEMKANTAIGLVLLGAALWILRDPDAAPGRKVLAHAFAAVALVIGLLSLAEYVLGRQLGIDQLLFSDRPESASDPTVHPGRLAPQTAIGFVMTGAALIALDWRRRLWLMAEVLAVATGAITLFAMLGYLYASGNLEAVAAFHPIAVHTALALLLLSVGILLARPDRGIMGALRSKGPGSDLARLLLPVVFLALPLMGWLLVWGQHAGLYDSDTDSALMIVVLVALLSAGIIPTALRLNRSDRARRQSDALLGSLVEHAPSIVYVKDIEGRYMLVNQGFERLTGVRAVDIRSRTMRELFSEDTYHERATDIEVARTNAPLHLELVIPVDGEQRTFMWVKFPLRDNDGRVIGIGGIANDITDRKRAEEKLERARAEAERANQAKNEFLSRMSHELRTPLAAVMGFGQLLEMGELSDRQATAVKHILKGGRHLLDLINELLDISRIESGNLAISIEPVDVRRVIAEVLPMIEPLAGGRDISIEVTAGDGESRWVLADMQRLKQVLLNLLSNAVKYNSEGGRVTISFRQFDSREQILVTDTGAGIPADRLGRLFVPFERLDPDNVEVEGTGLGLALSKGLLDAMGGEIAVESTPGRGSTFSAILERAVAPGDLVGPAGEPFSRVELPSCTILYIEDNPANLGLVEGIIEQYPDVTLLSAMQGGLGIELAVQHVPDLVLLDVNLPDISGVEVLRRLTRHPGTANIPVVILSADATRTRIQQLLDSGARAYITKPLELREFLQTIAATVGRRSPEGVAS
jgi:PAS domain S-box-containing protein